MEKIKGFLCVVYFESGNTAKYHSQWNPAKLARALTNPWKWMKIYIMKSDYELDKANSHKSRNYYAIFDKDNPIKEFNFGLFYGKYFK
ncbi:TPA: hypothetical protein ACGZ9U_003701 [Elizabethkingia anophelis]